MGNETVDKVATWLVIIGALIMGLSAVGQDVLGMVGGGTVAMVVQALVGLSGLWMLWGQFQG